MTLDELEDKVRRDWTAFTAEPNLSPIMSRELAKLIDRIEWSKVPVFQVQTLPELQRIFREDYSEQAFNKLVTAWVSARTYMIARDGNMDDAMLFKLSGGAA